MDAIRGLFSSPPGIERVSKFGLIVMALAVVLLALSGTISRKFKNSQTMGIVFKISALLICVIGFIIAIY